MNSRLPRMRSRPLLALLALVSASGPDCKARPSPSCRGQPPMLLQLRQGLKAEESSAECQTTLPTDQCYQEIMVDSHRLANPGAYAELPENASLEERQNFYYSKGPALNSTFQPIDGGTDCACRGKTVNDNHPRNYEVKPLGSLEDCEQECRKVYGCKAVEYSRGRCELWFQRVNATK
ncbi:unnamed protein product, partial [Durusdinium trenchii]